MSHMHDFVLRMTADLHLGIFDQVFYQRPLDGSTEW